MGLWDFFRSSPASEMNKKPEKVEKREQKWKDPNEQEKYVCEAGKVMCLYCTPQFGGFMVTSNMVYLQDRFYVTEGDNNGKVNLDFQGVCTHPSQQKPSAPPPPCKMVISTMQWKNTADESYIDNYKALLVKSTIPCMISGQDIKIVHSGQKAVLNNVKPDIKKELSPYLFYKKDGTYLAGNPNIAAKVYITEEDFDEKTKKTREEWDTIKENSKELFLCYGDLIEISSIANGEAGVTKSQEMQKRELFAIATSVVNFLTMHHFRSTKGIGSGYSSAKDHKTAGYKIIKEVEAKGKNKVLRLKTAMAAGINSLLDDGVDYANGATHWDGTDVLKPDKLLPKIHFRYRAHSRFSYIKGIYDPKNMRQSFYNNSMQYDPEKDIIKQLTVIDEKVKWDLSIESERSIISGQNEKFKTKNLELITLDENKTLVPRDLYKYCYKGPGDYLWYYPKNIWLWEVVAQEGISIFYTTNEKPNLKEILSH